MKGWLERSDNSILLVALLAGAILRWLQISSHSFWYDEALTSLIASLSLSEIVANAAATDHPPAYYLLLHFWLQFGRSDLFIRSLSALFSLATIPLMYGLGRWLFDRTTGTVAALATAILPFQIYFAQETRMYGLAIFIAAALTWLFLRAVLANAGWRIWLGYALIATVGLYTHYFTAFLLLGLHLWWLLNFREYRSVSWRLALADGLIALLFLPQLGQALGRTSAYLGGVAWQATPHILSPLTTLYYLLFAHRTPIWLFPITLFLTLTLLILTLWEVRRRSARERKRELALWLSLVTPIVIVIVLSWLVRPIYLERSFAVSSPALILLLAHGASAAPRWSPTPYLAGVLGLAIVVNLGLNLTTADPAKPPVRQATQVIQSEFVTGDVSLHLHDASFMPATWYAPGVPQLLVDVPDAAWTVVATHQLFGGEVVAWSSAVAGADRLWLTVLPGFTGPQQQAIHEAIVAKYPELMQREWGPVQLYLYDLRGTP